MVILGPGTQEEKEEIMRQAKSGYRKERARSAAQKIQQAGTGFSRASKGAAAGFSGFPKKSSLRKMAGTPQLRRTLSMATGVNVTGSSKGRVKQGRGRPIGSYIPRNLPGVGIVKMPIQQYKKALRAVKAQARYQEEIQKAKLQQRLAARVPMDHTGRGQMGEFAYADGEEYDDMGAEMPMEMPMEQAPAPGMGQRIAAWLARKRAEAAMRQSGGYGANAPLSAGFGPSNRITMLQGGPRAPRMNVWGGPGPGNILNTPNIFNKPDTAKILFKGRPRF